jgi:tetratricopeptide (TPR) repeat protein
MAKGKAPLLFHQPKQAIQHAYSGVAAILQQAEAAYRKILRKQHKHFDALHLLGVIEAQRRNFASAVDLIGRAIKLDSGSAAAHANMGNALRDLKRYEKAVASYDRALSLKPDYPEALVNRGNALLALKRDRKSVV